MSKDNKQNFDGMIDDDLILETKKICIVDRAKKLLGSIFPKPSSTTDDLDDFWIEESELVDEDESFENTTLLSFVNDKDTVSDFEPKSTVQLNKLLSETTDLDELFLALKTIDDNIANIIYWNQWSENQGKAKEKAANIKREMIIDRIRTISKR